MENVYKNGLIFTHLDSTIFLSFVWERDPQRTIFQASDLKKGNEWVNAGLKIGAVRAHIWNELLIIQAPKAWKTTPGNFAVVICGGFSIC